MLLLRVERICSPSPATSEFGTYRTWSHVRLESAMHTKADVRHSGFIGSRPESPGQTGLWLVELLGRLQCRLSFPRYDPEWRRSLEQEVCPGAARHPPDRQR